jgi:hypothetical protein
MRKKLLGVMTFIFTASCFAGSMTWASFETQDLGSGQWQYTYTVANNNLTESGLPVAIKEFTLWFDPAIYSNLVVITTPLSTSWDSIVMQPESVLHDAGAYDALVKSGNLGILPGQIVKGFSVKFNWLGAGTPGPQPYEIVNPVTFKTIEAGMTIPEPATMLLLGLGGLLTIGRKS